MRTQIKNAAIAFPALLVIGFAAGLARPEITDGVLTVFTNNIASAGFYEFDAGTLMAALLLSNMVSALMPIVIGLVPFLRLPAFPLGLNALLMGALAAYYQRSGFGLAAYLAGTLPHGITEIAALACSCGAGLYLCDTLTDRMRGRKEEPSAAQALSECIRVYTRRVVPLLIFSAVIEAYVTPRIFALFMPS